MFNTFKTNLTILIDSLRGIDDVNHSKLKQLCKIIYYLKLC